MSMKNTGGLLWKLPFLLLILGTAGLLGLNAWMKSHVRERILTPEEAAGLRADCILVLGAGVRPDGSPSVLLEDRLSRGIDLYRLGASERLLMSGDHGQADYNEVGAMGDYALDQGVPSQAVFLDHAGFSTYESMYRAREVFQARRVVIVTQEYHLYRALYDAQQLGLEAWGVPAAPREYQNQGWRDLREVLARGKDFLWTWLKPEPAVLGEPVPLSGDEHAAGEEAPA